jgi:hypothetical protein
MPDQALVVTLEVSARGREVTATLTLLNKGRTAFPLEKFNACTDGTMEKELFEVATVTAPPKQVAYVGMTAKRPPSGPNDYLHLAPGKSLSNTVRLDRYYDFPPAGGMFVARYSVYNALPEGGLSQLVSNSVTFRVDKSN